MSDYDSLTVKLGEFGKYQKLVFFLCCGITSLFAAFNNMGIVFLAASPEHWCRIPGLHDFGLDADALRNLTVPMVDKDGKQVFSQCQKYDRDYRNWTMDDVTEALASGNGSGIPVSTCTDGWEYDTSTYQSTIVTQWDLVCGKKALVPTVASIYMAGLMVGVVVFGFVSDTYALATRANLCYISDVVESMDTSTHKLQVLGRRVAYITCSVMMVTFAIAFPFSTNYIVFASLRFLLAMSNIGLFTTAFVIGVEMVGPSYRVFAGIVVEYFWACGYIIIAAVAYGLRDWKPLALALSVPQALILIFIFFIPESPRWLYSQNKHEKADVIIRKIAKVNKVTLPAKIDVVVKKAPKAYVWDLFRYPKLRLRTVNIFFNWFVNSMVYYGLSLNTSNLGGNDYVNFFIAGAVEFPAYFFCQISLHYLGRRWSLAGTMVVGGVALLAILAVPAHLNVIAIVLAMVGKFCISASFAIIYVFSAEIFPTVVRNVGVGSGSFWARVGGIIAPYIGSLGEISKFIPYITFGALSIAAGLLALLLPETKGHQLPETIEDGEKFPNHTAAEQVDETGRNGQVNSAFNNDSDIKISTKI